MESYIGGTSGGGQSSTEHITDRKVGDRLLDRYEIFDIKSGGPGAVFFVSGSRAGVTRLAMKIAD